MNLYEMINNHQNRLQYLLEQGYLNEDMYQELYNKFWDSLPNIKGREKELDYICDDYATKDSFFTLHCNK